MQELIERFSANLKLRRLFDQISNSAKKVSVGGVVGSARSLLVAAAFEHLSRPIAYILEDGSTRERAGLDLSVLIPPAYLVQLDDEPATLLARIDRLRVGRFLLISHSLSVPLPAPQDLARSSLKLVVQIEFRMEELLSWLSGAGYERTDLVSEPGEYAYRGGIVDCFPPQDDRPLRLEFFGDRIESIRRFDPLTQRSVERVEGCQLFALNTSPGEGSLIQYLPVDTLVFSESILDIPFQEVCFSEDEGYDLDFGQVEPPSYLGNLKLLSSEVEASNSQYYIFCGDEYQRERLNRLLGDKPIIYGARLGAGFEDPTGYCVLTERELYGGPIRRAPRRRFKGLPVDDLLALRKGDLVVHQKYGIGRFEGIERLKLDGLEKDFLSIRYAGGGRLLLPVERIGFLDRYLGPFDSPPQLDRLGRTGWLRAKARVARAVAEYAQELLEIQSRRSVEVGHSFSPDTPEQLELEASFPYEETPDQLKALDAVKRDMESPRPMDRLICGDVGYGKTELAIRAAFKAVQDYKQVALLAPTTILCYQHYETFKERLKNFPVRVEMLSRFVSRREQAKILADLAKGRVDIIIGTHMLLSPQVRFRDLGLLIVDEEQRFGVREKERLKQLKATVDVLTLTATPIPRTLYMSLVGLKEISTIRTPPLGRKDIVTEVAAWDDGLISHWIRREVARSGQVFFIHNRVGSIERVAERLKSLLPDLRLGVAHGQMPERQLSQVYLDFLSGAYDILVSTAIVEAGLDMPQVNTIIIDQADRFGLADLHQLRGRVGRSSTQAYALLLIPEDRSLSQEARKRLSAILAYAKLGSGFKLALRDMEIRGVGNLLGVEQHGHVARVGFNLYCQLLREAIARLKGEEIPPEPKLSLDTEAYIPEDYIPDTFERVAIYRRLLGVEDPSEVESLKDELRDRFGRYPEVIENLFKIALVRLYARKLGAYQVTLKAGRITIQLPKKSLQLTGGLNTLIGNLQRFIEASYKS